MEEMNGIFDCKTSEENPLRKLGLDRVMGVEVIE
jgi:hypothetical protein